MIYVFADCELHTGQHTLKRAGQQVHLRPQVYKVLLHLLEHRDRVFSTDELIEALWPDPHASNGTVESTIKGVRRAVGDDGKTQRIIQTLNRQGYRFVAHLKGSFEVTEPGELKKSEETAGWPCRFCQSLNHVPGSQKSGFCTQCGQPFGTSCSQCGVENSPQDNYCSACGSSLAPTPKSIEHVKLEPELPKLAPERRQLTVMSCDLVEAVSLSEQLDLEDYRDIIRLFRTACDDVIRHFEGHIAHDLGVSLLVYFGYPRAHEDDAQRAVRTGLAIIQALEALNSRLSREKNVTLAVRWGIHTGPAVVEEFISGAQSGTIALGEGPTIALQIQKLAAPDTGIIVEATARLVKDYFVCQDLGLHTCEEGAQPLRLFRVLEPRTQSPKGRTPFVGRDVEIALLLDRWAQAKDGFGQIVLISGEPGIGKSRLVQIVKDRLSEERYALLECRCSPYHQHSALYPIIDLFEHRLHWEKANSPEKKLQKLETFLLQHALPLNDTVPFLAALLSLPVSDGRYRSMRLTSQQQRQKILEALQSIVFALTSAQPTMLIVEDLHWIDPSTLEFLGLLVEQVPAQNICVVFTYRPVFHPSWGSGSSITHMPLTRLSRPDAEHMVAHITGGKVLPAEVLMQIIEKTDGVPLFVEEFTKSLIETGALQEVKGQYELIAPLQATAIPATLHDSLMARLDRLDIAKRVAQLGAVLGRKFTYALLHAVWEQDAYLLQRGLGRLVEAELLYQQGRPPQASYMFKHILIQETAYQSLLKSMRQQYHKRVAHVLRETFSDIPALQPELLAHHYTEAGQAEQALPYWQRAGQLAVERSANIEAISHFTKGLDLLKAFPETPERIERELTLQLAMGSPLIMIKGHSAQEVSDTYTRAYELCQRLGDNPQRFWSLTGLWGFHLNRAQLETSHEIGQQCFILAQRLQDSTLLQEAYLMLGTSLLFLGEWAKGHEHLEQGIALYTPTPGRARVFPFSRGIDSGVVCLSRGAWTLWMLGYPDQALQRAKKAYTLAQRLSHTYSIGFALHYLAVLHQCRREISCVQEQAEAVMQLGDEYGFVQWLAAGKCMRGWALAEQGAIKEGIDQLREGMNSWQNKGTELAKTHMFLRLAEAYKKGEKFAEGLHVLANALTVVRRTSERYYEAELYRLRGELLLHQVLETDDTSIFRRQKSTVASIEKSRAISSRETGAEACFLQAIDVARHQGAKSLELRAVLSLCRLWTQKQGKRAASREMLGNIYNWFTEGFDTLDLQEAKACLDVLA